MSGITVINHSNTKIWVCVTMLGGDRDKGGSERFFALNPNGGSDTWNYRQNWQVVYITRADNAGAELETKLAIPGSTKSMRAYYFDNLPGDQRLPHDFNPSRPVDPDTLESIRVEAWHIPIEGHEEKLDGVAKERNYRNRDVIEVSKEGLGDVYEEKLKGFFKEHIHEDEEIRYILQGGGFFDVRQASSDEWIRLAVSAGDLLVIPAGIYHRFTVDERNLTRTIRLFKDEPKWSAIYRGPESDSNPHRIEYLKSIAAAA